MARKGMGCFPGIFSASPKTFSEWCLWSKQKHQFHLRILLQVSPASFTKPKTARNYSKKYSKIQHKITLTSEQDKIISLGFCHLSGLNTNQSMTNNAKWNWSIYINQDVINNAKLKSLVSCIFCCLKAAQSYVVLSLSPDIRLFRFSDFFYCQILGVGVSLSCSVLVTCGIFFPLSC